MDINENTPEKAASDMTVEDWERKFLLEKIDTIATRLERLAQDVRLKKRSMDFAHFSSYTTLVGEIIHDVTWGVANLTLDTALRGASAADIDVAVRKAKEAAE